MSLIILMTVISAFSAEKVKYKKDMKIVENICFKCHPDVKKQLLSGIPHMPANRGECVECHNPHTSNYKNFLIKKGFDLCYRCHQKEKKNFNKGFVHLPIAKGECVKCHNPHSSKNKKILKEEKSKICFTCHKKGKIFSRKNIHQPLKKGDCLKCHNPHASDNESMLVENGNKLCSGCHPLNSERVLRAHNNSLSKTANCLGCHNPHSSNHDALMREFSHKPYAKKKCNRCHLSSSKRITMKMKRKGNSLCLSCHKDVEKQFQKVFSHVQGFRDNTCLECHNPHASESKGLKRSSESKICFSCHTNTERRIKGKNPMFKYKHSDIEKCTNCHMPHGSNYRLFMISDENSSCGKCHETQGKFTHPIGYDSIDPRSKRAMTCISCHNPMGAEDEYSVRFGRKKKLCIKCHKNMR